MPRALSAAVLAAIAAKTVTIAMFAEIAFADNTLYLFSGVGTITPAGPPANPASTFPYGETFTGLGWLAKFSAIPQTTKVQAQNVTLSLSGIPANLVSEAVGQVRIAGSVTLWFGLFSTTTDALLADPVQVFAGSLDVPSLADNADTSTLSITCENSLLSLNLAPNRRFDDPDQQLEYPGDLGLSFVQALQTIQLFWPSPADSGSPYPVFMSVSPSSVDLAVGASITIEVTVHYSDGSTYTRPAGTGSGPVFDLGMASSNPKIATFQYTSTGNVTGVSPGACNIMARIPYGSSTVGIAGEYRSICSIFVHS
ncbi:MAG TPA: Ig-like domain-containing protein [Candidatus Sulfotelmatobacter sp.]|jgi:hypothetical protein